MGIMRESYKEQLRVTNRKEAIAGGITTGMGTAAATIWTGKADSVFEALDLGISTPLITGIASASFAAIAGISGIITRQYEQERQQIEHERSFAEQIVMKRRSREMELNQ